MSSFTRFGGIDEPNNFTNNLMSAISTRTGAPVYIRVGGTSMDNIIFNASSPKELTVAGNQDNCGLHTNATIGSPWLSAFKNFNPATRFTVEVPLARNHPANRIDFAKACIAAMPGGIQQLYAIEIGNEPDLYASFPKRPCGPPDRPASYGPDDYAAERKAAAKQLSAQVGALGNQTTWYQALTLANGVNNQHTWNITALWEDIDQGGFVKTVSEHYYQADACSDKLQDGLMNHSRTVSEMQSRFGASISFLKKQGTPFILGEVGTALGKCPHSPPADLFGSLGAALWTADFMLHGMSMGIEGVSMMQGVNVNFSAWQPVPTPRFPKAVHGNWYGHVFAADFIGAGGDFQISPLTINATYPDIVGYAGYNSGLLTKLAVLDMRFWESANDTARPSVNIDLANLEADITGARVSRLTAPGGASKLTNISWAGKQWSADDDGQEPRGNNSVVVKVTSGSLAENVTIFASEALLFEMIRA
ncbi:hypothetical protein FB451DRAFT_1535217 [Mycena latifolia]|nr:hypothetical protein FB451DRAFT_1535217 [Mycena latifolia]